MAEAPVPVQPAGATGVLVLADGTSLWGIGLGAEGSAVGEVCFNTAMTGYQEAMTDPSYAGQIITFTTPHIGNTGANAEDVEATNPHALGCVLSAVPSEAASWRASGTFDSWLKSWGRIGLAGVDTRAITRRIREAGAPNAVIAHAADGVFDLAALQAQAAAWPGLEGMDLAKVVSATQSYTWDDGLWTLGQGYATHAGNPDGPHVVAVDYGIKRNILRNLVAAGARVTVVPATATFDEIMAHKPAGIFLSNGPGDPAATGVYAVPTIQAVLNAGVPLFGICLGHQLLGLAVGREHVQDAPGPPRRQPPGQAPERRPRRDHQHEPRVRGRYRDAAGGGARDPRQPVRRVAGGAGADRPPGVQRAVSPRGEPGAAGQPLSVRAVCGGVAVTATGHLSPPGRGRETVRSTGPGEGEAAAEAKAASEGSRPSPQPSPRRGEGAAARPVTASVIQRQRAKAMRSEMTPPEAVVWKMLRAKRLNGHKFSRQVPIGPYIVDFAARREKLIVELDGRSHDATESYDARRERVLTSIGYRVLRFTNGGVATNLDGIARTIDHALGRPEPR